MGADQNVDRGLRSVRPRFFVMPDIGDAPPGHPGLDPGSKRNKQSGIADLLYCQISTATWITGSNPVMTWEGAATLCTTPTGAPVSGVAASSARARFSLSTLFPHLHKIVEGHQLAGVPG
jgi:hypothetical protein